MLALGNDRLVSWGNDGAIRFWDQHGNLIPGGDLKAHAAWIQVLALGAELLVSSGSDGAIRYWDRYGESTQGGDLKAHAGQVLGMLALDGYGLVSWGTNDVIRFWDQHGNRVSAHFVRGDVKGIISLGDVLVSWGRDGAIRFWATSTIRALSAESTRHLVVKFSGSSSSMTNW